MLGDVYKRQAMSDGVALFHADHGNLGSTALSYAAWDATRVAMRKQTSLNSGERLGGIVVMRHGENADINERSLG